MASFDHFSSQYFASDKTALVALDYSKSGMTPAFLEKMAGPMAAAFEAMEKLEAGAIANPDENRRVGHYWLRDLSLIPNAQLRDEVIADDARLRAFIADVHAGRVKTAAGGRFRNLLSIGIGGSALGPMLVADALGKDSEDKLRPFFLDNTDPEGIARVLNQLEGQLGETLCLVISKSGGTPETRNGMLLAEAEYRRAGLDFGKHAVAITGVGSKLDKHAESGGWIARFPMYDWVGGRTSVMSAVGLLPAGLQGIDIEGFLSGARAMDVETRVRDVRQNPAALLALFWHHATNGRGEKDMVVLPYKDRLQLFSRYLQQLVMESLGKEHDLDGRVVEQGITVYGNKGSTDQHAYVQQLRDGVNNFFTVFIQVLRDGGDGVEVEPGVTTGDYLNGFYQGTRRALADKNRASATLTIEAVTPESLGALVALFERAVGFYASLVNINAYHQPGVEAGKKAAGEVLDVQKRLFEAVSGAPGTQKTAKEWAAAVGCDAETAFLVLQHAAHNNRGISMKGLDPANARFGAG